MMLNQVSMTRRIPLLALMPFLASFLSQGEALAAVINSVWTGGAGNGLWNSGMNWSPSGAPNNGTNTYNVTINSNGLPTGVTITTAITVSSLSLSGSNTALATNANLTVSGSSTVAGGLDVNSGTCSLNSLSNFSGTALTGGRFSVSNATLSFTGANIVTNAANITLTGSTSKILDQNGVNALANFGVNDATGDFAVADRTFSTTSPTFTNNGIIEAIANSLSTKITITGSLTNFSGTTLTGGEYDIGNYSGFGATSAMIQFPGANIVTNAATIVLYGAGTQFVNPSGVNALSGLATNTVAGSLSIYERNFILGGSLSNAGYIGLETYSFNNTLTVGGTLTNTGTCSLYASGANNSLVVNTSLANFSGTTLTNGEFNLAAELGLTCTLKFPNANIVTNAAAISLTGQGAQIVNSSNVNGLANFGVNAATGEFHMADRNLTTIGNFTNNGLLEINAWSVSSTFASSGAFNNAGFVTIGVGSTLAISSPHSYSQSGGVTTLAGGTLSAGTVSIQGGQLQGSGTIIGNVVTSGSTFSVSIRGLNPGEGEGQYDQTSVTGTAVLGGTLHVTLASGMAGILQASTTFTIFTTTGSLGGSFTNAENGSRITTSDKAGSFLVTMTAQSIVLSDFYPTIGLSVWKTSPGLFTPAELADPNFNSADPDGDGLTNLMEYSLNRQPHFSDAGGVGQVGIVTIGSSQYLGITFTRSKGASDITYQVEVSGDLTTWKSGAQFTAFQNRIDQGATELITWSDNTTLAGATKRFIRLKLLGP